MHILILGAGVIGTCTAWHLLERGHDVTVVERQGGAALESDVLDALTGALTGAAAAALTTH